MEKVLLTKEQAEAIELWLNKYTGGKEQLIKTHISDGQWTDESSALNGMSLEKLIKALYIGYEVEPGPEEKVIDYYELFDEDGKKIIKETLDLFNIQVPGINC